jgi:hypothetical protein
MVPRQWNEKGSPVRKTSALWLFSLALVVWLAWHHFYSSPPVRPAAGTMVEKRPIEFETHTFDPAAPPADMPPLRSGEQAECESNFVSTASVTGDTRKMDATHATVKVSRVKMVLGLRIAVWVPREATEQVIEHEQGHRQISEHYYQAADKVAGQIAASYVGREFFVSGANLDAEINRRLEDAGREITQEYNRGLNPEPAQQRYDEVTDHSRNGIPASEALAQILREANASTGP